MSRNQNTQMKLLNFENWGVYTGKMPKIGNRFRKFSESRKHSNITSAGQFGGELRREISPWSITVWYWSIGILYWELETSITPFYEVHMKPPPLQIPNLNTGETC